MTYRSNPYETRIKKGSKSSTSHFRFEFNIENRQLNRANDISFESLWNKDKNRNKIINISLPVYFRFELNKEKNSFFQVNILNRICLQYVKKYSNELDLTKI